MHSNVRANNPPARWPHLETEPGIGGDHVTVSGLLEKQVPRPRA